MCLVLKELDSDNSSPTLQSAHVAGNVVLVTVVGILSVVKIVYITSVWYGRSPGILSYAECCPIPGAPSGG
ncbi:hypothetical protein [Sulfuricaulis sp.]|jgi:hypothetical protein|uniref:hypothetical protein n=1 Tax=Sulfuricaulis sp. TaxID=2003553 RepID=UPI003559DE78